MRQLCSKSATSRVTFGRQPEAARSTRVSFNLDKGETLALVGESGSGKSVTALSILQLLPYPLAAPPGGQHPLRRRGAASGRRATRLRQVRGNRIAMVFQEPMTSLNPLHTIEQQIAEIWPAQAYAGRPAARARTRTAAARRPARGREAARAPIRTSSPAASASAS